LAAIGRFQWNQDNKKSCLLRLGFYKECFVPKNQKCVNIYTFNWYESYFFKHKKKLINIMFSGYDFYKFWIPKNTDMLQVTDILGHFPLWSQSCKKIKPQVIKLHVTKV
jgi:hypothetical protein